MPVSEEKTGGWRRLTNWLRGRQPEPEEQDEYAKLREEIELAREEWAIAQKHIDYVSDPELIDHAIYYLEAAERKYGFLLREAKRKYEEDRQLLEPSL